MTGNDGKARVNVDLNDFQYKPMPSRKRDGHRADTDGLDDRIEALQAELARNWELRDDGHRIERTFRFRNFQEAFCLVRNVGDLAETEGHHPDISFGWSVSSHADFFTMRRRGLTGFWGALLRRPLAARAELTRRLC